MMEISMSEERPGYTGPELLDLQQVFSVAALSGSRCSWSGVNTGNAKV